MQSFIQFQKMVQEIQIKQAKGDILTFLLTYLLKYILTKGSRKKSYFLVDRPLRPLPPPLGLVAIWTFLFLFFCLKIAGNVFWQKKYPP